MKETRTGNYRWVVVALLFFATTINYLDRQIIGLLKPTLENQFHWTESDYSNLVSAFAAAYAVGLVIFGYVIDKVRNETGLYDLHHRMECGGYAARYGEKYLRFWCC